jgi:methyl-accepting chemotaxis protein
LAPRGILDGVTAREAAAGLSLLGGLSLRSVYQHVLAEKKQQVQHLVDIAYSTALQYRQMEIDGRLSGAEARQRALEALRSMHYGDNNYFGVSTLHPTVMIMHPYQPALVGATVSGLRDADGKPFYSEIERLADGPGFGFVTYRWSKPGAGQGRPVPKLAFVRRFEPWKWAISSGIYIDDVDAAWTQTATQAGGVAVLCFVVLVAVCATL